MPVVITIDEIVPDALVIAFRIQDQPTFSRLKPSTYEDVYAVLLAECLAYPQYGKEDFVRSDDGDRAMPSRLSNRGFQAVAQPLGIDAGHARIRSSGIQQNPPALTFFRLLGAEKLGQLDKGQGAHCSCGDLMPDVIPYN